MNEETKSKVIQICQNIYFVDREHTRTYIAATKAMDLGTAIDLLDRIPDKQQLGGDHCVTTGTSTGLRQVEFIVSWVPIPVMMGDDNLPNAKENPELMDTKTFLRLEGEVAEHAYTPDKGQEQDQHLLTGRVLKEVIK